jgi:hypothetical protein
MESIIGFIAFRIRHLRDPEPLLRGWKENCLFCGVGKGGHLMLILLILLIVLLIGATPAWPYSRGWGYYPTGVLGTILVIFLVLLLLGQVNL